MSFHLISKCISADWSLQEEGDNQDSGRKMFFVARGLTKSWMTEQACEDSTRLPGRDGLTDHKVEPSIHQWPCEPEQGQSVWFHRTLVSPQRPIGFTAKTWNQKTQRLNFSQWFMKPWNQDCIASSISQAPPSWSRAQAHVPSWAPHVGAGALGTPTYHTDSDWPPLALPLGLGLRVSFTAAQAVSFGRLALSCPSDPGMLTGCHQGGARCSPSGMPLCCPPPGQSVAEKGSCHAMQPPEFNPGLASCQECKGGSVANMDCRTEGHHSCLVTGTNMSARTTCWMCRQVREQI